VIDHDATLLGVITPSDLLAIGDDARTEGGTAGHIMHPDPLVTYPDEILRAAADQMAEHCVGALPVVTRDTKRVLGILTEFDLLKARQKQLEEERHRERVLRLRRLTPPSTIQVAERVTVDAGNPTPVAPAAVAPVAVANGAGSHGAHDTGKPAPDSAEPDHAPAEPAPAPADHAPAEPGGATGTQPG
ncbi:MAG: CBS domain-containing protein, partial [Trebonia sp.]